MNLKIIVALFCAILLGILYARPTISSKYANDFPVAEAWDGAFYTMRLKAALEGDKDLSCVEDHTLKTPNTWMPATIEKIWAGILRPFVGTNIFKAVQINYLLLPGVTFALLLLSLFAITRNYWLSLIIAFLGCVEPNAYFWKPFSLPSANFESYLPFLRYANPLLKSLPMLASLAFCFQAIRSFENQHKHRYLWMTLTSLAAGLTFYTQSFYWSWMWGTFSLLTLFFLIKKQKDLATCLAVICGVSLAIGLPGVISNLKMAQDEFILEVLHRVGLMLADRTAHSLFHKSFFLTVIVHQILAYKKYDWRWAFFTASAAVAYFGLNQNVVTGIYNQEHHYFRPLNLIYILFLGEICCLAWERIKTKLSISSIQIRAICTTLMLIFIAKASHFSNKNLIRQEEENKINIIAGKYRDTFQALEKIAAEGPRPLVLSHPKYVYNMTMLTRASMYVHSYTHQCMIRDNEFYNRWLFLHKAYGFSKQRYSDFLHASVAGNSLPWFMHGLTDSYKGTRNINTKKDLHNYAQANIDDYEKRSFAELVRSNKELPNYIIEMEDHRLDYELVSQHFDLFRVYADPEAGSIIWRISRKN